MSIITLKILAALAILAMGILGGLIPLLAARGAGGQRFLSLGNAFAGGIFLGAGFIHMLPEAAETLESVVDYPLAPLLAGLGIVVLLLVDRVVFEARQSAKSSAITGISQPIYPVVLLVVLSIHSIIAGTALGLQTDFAHSVLVMLGILFHKGSAAFALIVSAQTSGADRQRLTVILTVFVLMTPLGVLLGMASSGFLEGPTAALFEGAFSALAAGTFIYVAVLDVIDSEMSRFSDRVLRFVASVVTGEDDVPMPTRDADRFLKFLLVIVGLASMALLALWV